jgi:hypothetical protein
MQRHAWLLAFLLAAFGAAHAQWEMENSGTAADLRGIDNVGGGVAWASGTNGTVLRTEDGGYLWQACAIPSGAEHLDFRGIQAFDANTAIVMSSGRGDLSRLYKTTDGCHKWKLILRNPDKKGFWDALQFDRGRKGFLLGDPVKGSFVLFASRDDGRTWNRKKNVGPKVQPSEQAAFAASNSSMTALLSAVSFASGGTGGAFVYSIAESEICFDACPEDEFDFEGHREKWIRQPVPIGNHTGSSGVFSLAANYGALSIADLQKADLGLLDGAYVAVGGDFTMPDQSTRTAAYTNGKTKAWLPSQIPPHGYRSAVAYDADAKTWITVGPNGTDVSTDNGRNCSTKRPTPTATGTRFRCPSLLVPTAASASSIRTRLSRPVLTTDH